MFIFVVLIVFFFFYFLVHSCNSWIVLFSNVHLFFPPFPPLNPFIKFFISIIVFCYCAMFFWLFFIYSLSFLRLSVSLVRLYVFISSSIFIIVHWNRLRMAALKSLSDNCTISVITTLSSVDYFFQSLWDFSRSWYCKWFPKTWTLGLLCYAELT